MKRSDSRDERDQSDGRDTRNWQDSGKGKSLDSLEKRTPNRT